MAALSPATNRPQLGASLLPVGILAVVAMMVLPLPLQSLNSVIQLIMSGQVFVPTGATQTTMEKSGSDGADLSEKELFVLRLAADGLTNKEIARDMDASEVTVKMHMRAICKKLGARNRAHAAMISRERALI